MHRRSPSWVRALLAGCALQGAGCSDKAGEVKVDDPPDAGEICAYNDMGWTATVVAPCAELDALPIGKFAFCYEEADPLVIDVEPISLRTASGRMDLGFCLSSDDAFVKTGGTSGNVSVSDGALSNPGTLAFISALGYNPLTTADGVTPCFGATALLDSGSTLASGATFTDASYYWKNGDDPDHSEQSFGSSPGGISADGDELEMPPIELTYMMITVDLNIPSPLTLENSGVDHFATPVDEDSGC